MYVWNCMCILILFWNFHLKHPLVSVLYHNPAHPVLRLLSTAASRRSRAAKSSSDDHTSPWTTCWNRKRRVRITWNNQGEMKTWQWNQEFWDGICSLVDWKVNVNHQHRPKLRMPIQPFAMRITTFLYELYIPTVRNVLGSPETMVFVLWLIANEVSLTIKNTLRVYLVSNGKWPYKDMNYMLNGKRRLDRSKQWQDNTR